jgi:hypothetical protein
MMLISLKSLELQDILARAPKLPGSSDYRRQRMLAAKAVPETPRLLKAA